MNEMKDQQTQAFSGPNFNELELKVLEHWDSARVFERSLEQTNKGTPFVFYDGPPFATGLPHYGHILGSTIKDAVGRYQTMRGRYVHRRWGWDCHGLPIENIVEKKLGISGKKQIEQLGVDRFNAECRASVLAFADEWGKTVRRMGRWVDFEGSYKTMDTDYMESVWWGLKQLWNRGLVYEDRKVLLYCSRCETPISNFEVAMDNSYRDVVDESVYSKFRLLPNQRIGNDVTGTNTYFLAWTTTPWTLPGNVTLNLSPTLRYVVAEKDGERLIVAKDRTAVLGEGFEVVGEYGARDFEGLEYEPPFPGVVPQNGRAFRVYAADFVTEGDGTGVVHNAAMYGEEDYELAKEKDLPRVEMLDQKGEYRDHAPAHLRGVFFKDAERAVIEDLKNAGLLFRQEPHRHSYPHCYRCGTPLFYSALPAWFINIQQLKPQLQKANEDVSWYPAHLKNGRFGKSVEQAPDWNISRNRYWATPLPFWRSADPSHPEVMCIGSVEELRKVSTNFREVYPDVPESGPIPVEVLKKMDLHRPYIDRLAVKGSRGQDMVRVPEVVDCWVESASMPFSEIHYPFEHGEDFERRYPADFVAEYIAQTRAWFYVSHVVGTALFGRAPFRSVVTTGTVLAEDGSKMSKSKGNYPDPWTVMERYGVDAIRFYLLGSPVMSADDLSFSEKGVQDVQRKVSMLLYNVHSFFRTYERGQVSGEQPESDDPLDRWLLARLAQLRGGATDSFDRYDTPRYCREVTGFVDDLSTWYLRRSRDRMKAGGEGAAAALKTLGYALVEAARVLAPVMPFLADYLYRDLTGKDSVHLAGWNESPAAPDVSVLEQMAAVRELASAGLAVRKEQNLPVRQPLARLSYRLSKNVGPLPPEFERLVLAELNVKKVDPSYAPAPASGSSTVVPGARYVERIDVDAELSDELKAEGYAREVERLVQDMRKKAGLKVGEFVDLYYNTQDAGLERVLTQLFDRDKTFVSQVTKSLEVEADFEVQSEIGGAALWLGVVRG